MQELERLKQVVDCQVFELCGPVEEHGSICYYVPTNDTDLFNS